MKIEILALTNGTTIITNYGFDCSNIDITPGTYYRYIVLDELVEDTPKLRYKNKKLQAILDRQYALARRGHNKMLMRRLEKQMEANIAND